MEGKPAILSAPWKLPGFAPLIAMITEFTLLGQSLHRGVVWASPEGIWMIINLQAREPVLERETE